MRTTITLLLLSVLGLVALREAPGAPARLQLGPLTVQLPGGSHTVLEAPSDPSVAPEWSWEHPDQSGETVHPRYLFLPAKPSGFAVPNRNRFEIEASEGTVTRVRVTGPPRPIRPRLVTSPV